MMMQLVSFCMYAAVYSQIPVQCFHLILNGGPAPLQPIAFQHMGILTSIQVVVIHGTTMQSTYAMLFFQASLTVAMFSGTAVTMDKCPDWANHDRMLVISAAQHVIAYGVAISWAVYRRNRITALFIKNYNHRMAMKKAKMA